MQGSSKLYVGVSLIPQNTTAPSVAGDIRYNSSTNNLEVYNGALDTIVTAAGTGTLTNKTITIKDNSFTIQNSSDITKQAIISLSALTTGTSIVLTAPPSTTTLVGIDSTQTLSNKTFSDAITTTQITTPSTPAAGKNKIYIKADNFLYTLNSSGGEALIGNSLTNPMTTGGDLIYGGVTGIPTRLPNGSSGQLLQSSGGTAPPVWTPPISPTLLLPTGAISMYGASSAPSGWLMCDGAAVSRTTFSALFAIISTTYGVGDGSTTFNVPNTQGIFVRGAGSQTISGIAHSGSAGTVQNDQVQGHFHTITDPGHTHTITDPTHNHSVNDPTHNHNLESNTGGGLANLNNGTQIAGLSGASATGYVAGPPFVSYSATGISLNASATGITGANSNTTGIAVVASITDGTNGTPRVGTETRPANIGLYYIIKT